MNLDRDQLLAKWREVEYTAPGGQEWRAISLNISAPVTLLLAVREPDGRIALLVEAPISPVAAPLFRMQAEGISVSDQRDTNERSGLRRLAVVLEKTELREVFLTLVQDLVHVARSEKTALAACASIAGRLSAWQACLRARRHGLSEAEQIGLMGELEVIRLAAPAIGYGHAIAAWQGPLDGLHDFVGSGAAIEVKSALGPSSLIRISDAAQLDTAGLACLVIARPRFRSDPDGLDLVERVGTVRDEIRMKAPGELAGFDDKLLRAGFIASEHRSGPKATLESIRIYEVRDGFPHIDPSSLPAAVTGVSYAIEERVLGDFAAEGPALEAVIRHLGMGAT